MKRFETFFIYLINIMTVIFSILALLTLALPIYIKIVITIALIFEIFATYFAITR